VNDVGYCLPGIRYKYFVCEACSAPYLDSYYLRPLHDGNKGYGRYSFERTLPIVLVHGDIVKVTETTHNGATPWMLDTFTPIERVP
jgi:hypothetical protein